MADQPIFSKGGATGSPLVLDKGIAVPVHDYSIEVHQHHQKTYDGKAKIAKWGYWHRSHVRKWKIDIKNISKANRDALVNFFLSGVVDWFVDTFDFQPEGSSGATYTVRLDPSANLNWQTVYRYGLAAIDGLVLREVQGQGASIAIVIPSNGQVYIGESITISGTAT